MVEVAKCFYEIDVQSQDFNQLGSSDAASSLEELGPDLVELDGDLSERIDTLNSELCNRIASIEKKVDTKLDSILELLQSYEDGNGDNIIDGDDAPVEIDGDLSQRIDALNSGMCERIARVEQKVDEHTIKLDAILELLQSQ